MSPHPDRKLKQLPLLEKISQRIIIGPTLKKEVIDDGIKIQAKDVEEVISAKNAGWLQAVILTPNEEAIMKNALQHPGLHAGEAEAIALAKERQELLLADDKQARTMATRLNIERIGTAGILVEAYVRKHITYEELHKLILKLTQISWIAPDVVAIVLQKAKEVRQ